MPRPGDNASIASLVGNLVPRRPLEDMLADQARRKAVALLATVGHSMLLEDQQVPPDVAQEQLTEQAALVADEPGLWSNGRPGRS